MHTKKLNEKILILISVILLSLFLAVGCCNAAAERLADDCWLFRVKLILLNENFTEREQELFFIEIMQANDFSDEQIADEIEKLRVAGQDN